MGSAGSPFRNSWIPFRNGEILHEVSRRISRTWDIIIEERKVRHRAYESLGIIRRILKRIRGTLEMNP